MIFQYVFLDYGAQNILKRVKYSAATLRRTIELSKQDHEIHLVYVKSGAVNSVYNIAASDRGNFFDKVQGIPFNDSINEKSVGMWPPWYYQNHLPYLNSCIEKEDIVIYMDSGIDLLNIFSIDSNAFYFWDTDTPWVNMPWVFLSEEDGTKFMDFCKKENILSGNSDNYLHYKSNMVYIPKKHVEEVRSKYISMMRWILDFYKHHMNGFYFPCTCASAICLSFIAKDICDRESLPIKLFSHEFKTNDCIRYVSEREGNISGTLRMFFE